VKKMNIYVNQSIIIQHFKVGNITNSSILQIGSAGMIKALSNQYNTGGFYAPAPAASGFTQLPGAPIVPLSSPA
jgi:spore germination protein PB